MLFAFCFIIYFNYVECNDHKPTRIEFDYINNRLNEIIFNNSLIPRYSAFTLEYCREFECSVVIDYSYKEAFCCRDNRKSIGIRDFIAFYFGSNGGFYIRNTDMNYDNIIELLNCLDIEFTVFEQNEDDNDDDII